MKAQFWSFDAIFAMAIFVAALVLLTFVWNSISNQFSLASGFGVVSMQAQLQGLQNRIALQGTPASWNSYINVSSIPTWSNVSIGLGTGSGSSLSVNKIMAFMAMSDHNSTAYQATKPLLGVGYDYYITISENNVTLGFGIAPYTHSPTSIQVAMQSVTINGVPAQMQIIVWTNKTFGVS
jgi:hypothetical protein